MILSLPLVRQASIRAEISRVHVEDAFVLGPIPHVVALRQDSPDLRAEAKGVWQHLKHDVPLRRSEFVMAVRRQTQCVSGAVGEIKPVSRASASGRGSQSPAS